MNIAIKIYNGFYYFRERRNLAGVKIPKIDLWFEAGVIQVYLTILPHFLLMFYNM